jgi:ParB family chromosome partitioning protein
LLEDNPYQPRLQIEQESLLELSNSIKKDGLQSPIKITPTENGRYIIVYGHRRVEAHRYLGMSKIKCFIEEMDESKLRRLALVENLQREDLSLIEKALSYANTLSSGDFSTQKELAEELGLKQTKVSEIMSLLNLDGNIIYDLKKDKTIKDTTALSLINKIEKDSQWEIYSLLKKGEIDREGIRKYLYNGIKKINSQCESKLKNNKLQLFYKIKIKEKDKQKAFKEFVENETKAFLEKLKEKENEFIGTTN